MNRRGFFSRFAVLAAAASLSPTVFIPKFEPVRWKVKRYTKAVINPDWVTARYQFYYVDMPMIVDRAILPLPDPGEPDPYWSVRCNKFSPDGKPIFIPPYILV